MKEPVKIFMDKADADIVQELFDKEEVPNFTVVSRKDVMDGYSVLELYSDQSCSFWFLAKKVAMVQYFRKETAKVLAQKNNKKIE